jgi:hypothetical protein
VYESGNPLLADGTELGPKAGHDEPDPEPEPEPEPEAGAGDAKPEGVWIDT